MIYGHPVDMFHTKPLPLSETMNRSRFCLLAVALHTSMESHHIELRAMHLNGHVNLLLCLLSQQAGNELRSYVSLDTK